MVDDNIGDICPRGMNIAQREGKHLNLISKMF